MAGADLDCTEITDRESALWFLESADIPLPEGLTVEKIRDRGAWWAIEDGAFSFRVERHPSPLVTPMSIAGGNAPTPARWHIRKRYCYACETGEWDITEQHREFHFDPGLLIEAEFNQPARKEMWADAIEHVRTADNPDAVLEEEFSATADRYREVCSDVPEDKLEEMLAVLKQAFRRRAGLE
jgi:hypothetical protein